jgi:hypothetical protein
VIDTSQRVAIARRWIAEQLADEKFLPDLARDLLLIADEQLAWLNGMYFEYSKRPGHDKDARAAVARHISEILARLAPHIPELQEARNG